jgi:hypothetical protein
MKRAILGLVFLLGSAACNQGGTQSIAGPSGIAAPTVQYSATVTVLDGADPDCNGVCQVTKYENYPSEPPSPTYYQQSYSDPCTAKWGSPWHTYALWWEGEPNDPWGPAPIHLCQQ